MEHSVNKCYHHYSNNHVITRDNGVCSERRPEVSIWENLEEKGVVSKMGMPVGEEKQKNKACGIKSGTKG